jgi:hypothetical protein
MFSTPRVLTQNTLGGVESGVKNTPGVFLRRHLMRYSGDALLRFPITIDLAGSSGIKVRRSV